MYGGIDSDVREMFFGLKPFTLKLVFNRYERDYGEGKRKYAEQTFKKWQAGKVQMSGEISDRLVRIVPPFLSFEQKFELIQKLWGKFRKKSNLHINMNPESGLNAAIESILNAVESLETQEVPDKVVDRLKWLAEDDSVVAKSLLDQIEQKETEIAIQILEVELRQLLSIAHLHKDKEVTGVKTVDLPSVSVYININRNVPIARASAMSDDKDIQSSNNELAKDQAGKRGGELAPIDNPHDLLGESLRRMSPKKQQEIIGKATDEALRLQVKQKEGDIDHDMAASKVASAADAANRLSATGNEFEIRAEHRSEHGSVQVSVRNRKSSITDRVGGCFVATACYENENHPIVLILRDFRDDCLRVNPLGRNFIAWYYRKSPTFAAMIQSSRVLRMIGRALLLPLAVLASIAITMKRK